MKKSYFALLVSVLFILATAGASFAAMGEGTVSAKKGVDLTLFGSNRFIPEYSTNLIDFDNSNSGPARAVYAPRGGDPLTLDEGGWGAGFFVRNELRLGFAGKGENLGFRVILEEDIHYSKNNVDRNTYVGYGNKSSDFGGEFAVERSKFWYDFCGVRFTTGWDVMFQDLKTGGLVYGDDHPFIALSGKINDNANWLAYMLLINDSDDYSSGNNYRDTDWYAYNLKFNFKAGGMTISPFLTYSDMRKDVQGHGNAHAYYAGLEAYGKIGMLMPSFEAVYVGGTINDAAEGGTDDYDISSYAFFASLKFDIAPEFQPYIGGYWVRGDDDNTDDDAEGFVGITNISRYSPTFGMEGGIMYEHMATIGAPLYGLTPERLGSPSARYGGISGKGSGDNPGLIYVGLGATGKLESKVSYKVQTAYLWFENEDGIDAADDDIGWVVDAQVAYPFSKNFVTSFTTSFLLPGDGVYKNDKEHLAGVYDDDMAWISRIEMTWKW
jgi:hypothetical protein